MTKKLGLNTPGIISDTPVVNKISIILSILQPIAVMAPNPKMPPKILQAALRPHQD